MPYRRINRRLFVLGLIVALLGVFTVIQSFYYREQDRELEKTQLELVKTNSRIIAEQQALIACMEESFQQFALTSQLRGDLGQREFEAIKRVNLAELTVRTDVEYVRAVERYKREVNALQREREENPVPDYPDGTCDQESE